jgi:hypothetical protein
MQRSIMNDLDRREFLKLVALGSAGVVCSTALPGMAGAAAQDEFYFVQLSDTHWGFEGPPNPDAKGTLRKAVAAVNALSRKPDFIVFTGDLTHTTDSPVERRRRLAEFKAIVSALQVKTVRFMPGEHDASLDDGKAFKEFFGPTQDGQLHLPVRRVLRHRPRGDERQVDRGRLTPGINAPPVASPAPPPRRGRSRRRSRRRSPRSAQCAPSPRAPAS